MPALPPARGKAGKLPPPGTRGSGVSTQAFELLHPRAAGGKFGQKPNAPKPGGQPGAAAGAVAGAAPPPPIPNVAAMLRKLKQPSLEAFQKSRGLEPTGLLDDDTVVALENAVEADLGPDAKPVKADAATRARAVRAARGPATYARQGDGAEKPDQRVAEVQELLAYLGYELAGGVTGNFDADTANAVRTYQRQHGLPTTGVVGPTMLQLMNEERSNRESGSEESEGEIQTGDADMTGRGADQTVSRGIGVRDAVERAVKATKPATETWKKSAARKKAVQEAARVLRLAEADTRADFPETVRVSEPEDPEKAKKRRALIAKLVARGMDGTRAAKVAAQMVSQEA